MSSDGGLTQPLDRKMKKAILTTDKHRWTQMREGREKRRGMNLNSRTHERITVKINYEKREKGRGDGRRLSCRCARWARLIGKAANSRRVQLQITRLPARGGNFTNKISGGAGSVLPGIGSETDGKAALNERSYRANRADRATSFPVGAPAGCAEQKKPCNRTGRCADREVHATRATFSPAILHHF